MGMISFYDQLFLCFLECMVTINCSQIHYGLSCADPPCPVRHERVSIRHQYYCAFAML